MADAKKGKDRSSAAPDERAAEAPAAERVTVTNTHRNQPILFHFLGGSVRLGPLEAQEVDRSCLASPELAQMVLTGELTVSEGRPRGAAPGTDKEARPAESTRGTSDRASARPTRTEEK